MLSVNDNSMLPKKNIIKDFWQSFLSLDLFTRLMLITFFLIIAVTPYIVANNQIFTSKAQTSQCPLGTFTANLNTLPGITMPRSSERGFGEDTRSKNPNAPTVRPGVRDLQEVPPNSSTARGLGSIVLNADQTTATVSLNVRGLSSNQTEAHIHGPATALQNAGILFPLPNGSFTNYLITLDQTQLEYLNSGLLYFNVHSQNHRDGEIRGQIVCSVSPTTPTTESTPTPTTPLLPSLTESPPPAGGIRAFPGAEGWGAESVGGRGGRVIEVTNLNDAGTGSLRDCVGASGPRICVFRVGGTIELSSSLRINNPYLTIAGQTAPGGGILIKAYTGIAINAHDVIIRYIRVRNLGLGTPGSGQTNLGIGNGGYNVIVDHCSTSWSLDENVQIWKFELPVSPDITDITVQRCVIAEGLFGHSTGMLIGGHRASSATPTLPSDAYLKVYEISIHHNLFVHNYDRNPRVASAGTQVINNVVYNWGSRVGVSLKKNTVDFTNNYWKPGPMSGSVVLKHESEDYNSGWVFPDPSIYILGNIVKGSFESPSADNWELIKKSGMEGGGSLPLSYRRYTSLAQSPNPIAIQSASDAYDSILADAGANAKLDCQGNWISNSDAVDLRVINDVKQGTGWTGKSVASPEAAGGFPTIATGTACVDTDHDGMPDEWESIHGFSSTDGSDGSKDADGDGYTNVEEYLNGM